MWSENTVCVILIILNLVYFRLKIRLPLFMLHGTWREYLSGCFRAALHACAVASVGGANSLCSRGASLSWHGGCALPAYSSAFVCFSSRLAWFWLRVFCGSGAEYTQAHVIHWVHSTADGAFLKLKAWGSPALSRSVSTVFLKSLALSVPLCHVPFILGVFQTLLEDYGLSRAPLLSLACGSHRLLQPCSPAPPGPVSGPEVLVLPALQPLGSSPRSLSSTVEPILLALHIGACSFPL